MEYDELIIHGRRNTSGFFHIRVSHDQLTPHGGSIRDATISPEEVAQIREDYDAMVKNVRQQRRGRTSRAAMHNGRLQEIMRQLGGALAEPTDAALPEIRDLCEQFLNQWEGISSSSRIGSPIDYADMLHIGLQMRNMFPGKAFQVLEQSLARIKTTSPDRGLRVIIDADANAQMLLDLPWEMIVLGDKDSISPYFLFLESKVTLMRQIRTISVAQTATITDPGAVQVFVARPVKGAPINAKLFEEALTPLYPDVPLDSWWSTAPDMLQVMRERLARYNPEIVQIVCHGSRMPITRSEIPRADMLLTFVEEDGQTYMHRVSPYDLLPVLKISNRLQVVLLTVCDSGRAEQPGTAQQAQAEPTETRATIATNIAYELIRGGIPLVIAMQDKITQSAAARFSQAFYKSLHDDASIEGALAKARGALDPYRWGMDWTMPVVYRGKQPQAQTAWPVAIVDWLETTIFAPRSKRNLRSTIIALSTLLIAGSIARWIFWPSSLSLDPPTLQTATLYWAFFGIFVPFLVSVLLIPERQQINDANERRAVWSSQFAGATLGYTFGGATFMMALPLVYLIGEWIPSGVWWMLLAVIIGCSLLTSIALARGDGHGAQTNFQLHPDVYSPPIPIGFSGAMMLMFFVFVPASLTTEIGRMFIEPLGPSSLGIATAALLVAMVVALDYD